VAPLDLGTTLLAVPSRIVTTEGTVSSADHQSSTYPQDL
jgi:hypothetical protein